MFRARYWLSYFFGARYFSAVTSSTVTAAPIERTFTALRDARTFAPTADARVFHVPEAL